MSEVKIGWRNSRPVRVVTGHNPSIAVNQDGIVIEVHKSEDEDTLWYSIGELRPDRGGIIAWSGSQEYDKGKNPAVAINDKGIVVEVHKSENDDDLGGNTLWYRVGVLAGDHVSWYGNGATQYDRGKTPSVAINNNNVVVEVHKSEGAETLWYQIGEVTGLLEIAGWGRGRATQYNNGEIPSIAINDKGTVVEVHKSEGNNTLWYRTGYISAINPLNTRELVLSPSAQRYDHGETPSVAINNNDVVVEVHKSEEDTLWSHIGHANWRHKGIVEWGRGRAKPYDNGVDPSVALTETRVVEIHKSQGSDDFWAHNDPIIIEQSRPVPGSNGQAEDRGRAGS